MNNNKVFKDYIEFTLEGKHEDSTEISLKNLTHSDLESFLKATQRFLEHYRIKDKNLKFELKDGSLCQVLKLDSHIDQAEDIFNDAEKISIEGDAIDCSKMDRVDAEAWMEIFKKQTEKTGLDKKIKTTVKVCFNQQEKLVQSSSTNKFKLQQQPLIKTEFYRVSEVSATTSIRIIPKTRDKIPKISIDKNILNQYPKTSEEKIVRFSADYDIASKEYSNVKVVELINRSNTFDGLELEKFVEKTTKENLIPKNISIKDYNRWMRGEMSDKEYRELTTKEDD